MVRGAPPRSGSRSDQRSDRPDPRAAIRRLFRDVDGFEISPTDSLRVARSRGASTYGELMPTATLRMLELLELGPEDVFVDLGSGVGKVVLLAALASEAKLVRGVELSEERVEIAREVVAEAEAEGLVEPGRVELVSGDMLRVPLDDATVIYTCSTAFSDDFMARLHDRLAALPNLRLLVSLQDFEEPPAFELVAIHRLDASWKRRTRVHVYTPIS